MFTRVTAAAALAALVAAFGLGTPHAPAQTPQHQEAQRVAIVQADVISADLGPNTPPVETMTGQVIAALFGRAGYETQLIQSPAGAPAGWASDRQLAEVARQVDADWVVYPRILVIGGASRPERAPATAAAETRAVLYVRVVNVSPTGHGTVYMRQVGHLWPREPAQVGAFGEPQGIPHGVAKAFQYFRPLNAALVARGQPSVEEQPLATAQTVWPAERVAGFRDTIRDR